MEMKLSEELLKEKIDKLSQLDRIEYQNKKLALQNYFNSGITIICFVFISTIIPLSASFLAQTLVDKIILFLAAIVIYLLGLHVEKKLKKGTEEHEEELDDWLRERIK